MVYRDVIVLKALLRESGHTTSQKQLQTTLKEGGSNYFTYPLDLYEYQAGKSNGLFESIIEAVALESAGVYWIPVFQILLASRFIRHPLRREK